MSCNICKIKNVELLNKIEQILDDCRGSLSIEYKNKLKKEFPDYTNDIDAITDNDCSIHWNFHQSIAREAEIETVVESAPASLTKDIGKDEAAILYEVLNKQVATFNCLTNKINKVISENDSGLQGLIINPTTTQFYKDIGDSIRANVKEIRELNGQINGSKNGALEGLKALAQALAPAQNAQPAMTTEEYDY